MYTLQKLHRDFSGFKNTASLPNNDSLQARSDTTSPKTYSATTKRKSQTLHDKVTHNKVPSVQIGIPRKSEKNDYKSFPFVVFNKWAIGIELNQCQDQFRACVNSFEISPKHLVSFIEIALGEVTYDK